MAKKDSRAALVEAILKRGPMAVLKDYAAKVQRKGGVKLANGDTWAGDLGDLNAPGSYMAVDRLMSQLPHIAAQVDEGGGSTAATAATAPSAATATSGPKNPMAEMMQMASSVNLGDKAALGESAAQIGKVTLPETVPLSTFRELASTPEAMESLSPGIIEKTYKYVVPGPDGAPHVRIVNREHNNPTNLRGELALRLNEETQVAMLAQQASSMGEAYRPKLMPLGDLMRQYGPGTVNTMFPGILDAGGYQPFKEKYGTDDKGRLLVPAFDDAVTSAPPTEELP